MKDLNAGMMLALRATTFHLAICWRVQRVDGGVLTFTSHDLPLVINDEGSPDTPRTYQPNNAFSATAMENKSNMSVSNAETFSLTSDDITEVDLLGGRYDKAVVEFFAVDWSDLTNGKIPLLKGYVGEVVLGDLGFTSELRDIAQAIQQVIMDVLSFECRADLFDDQCKVQKTPPVWLAAQSIEARRAKDGQAPSGSPTFYANTVRPTVENGFYYEAGGDGTTGGGEPTWPAVLGAVVVDNDVTWTAITARELTGTLTQWYDRRHFDDAGKTQPTEYWKYGMITWLSGANVDQKMEVREFHDGAFTLWEPMPATLNIGDTYRIQAGCAKRYQEDCIDLFANSDNIDCEPFLPGSDLTQQYADRK